MGVERGKPRAEIGEVQTPKGIPRSRQEGGESGQGRAPLGDTVV